MDYFTKSLKKKENCEESVDESEKCLLHRYWNYKLFKWMKKEKNEKNYWKITKKKLKNKIKNLSDLIK